jgi:hypothetical protein
MAQNSIKIVSGEGEQGTIEDYDGEQTAEAIFARLESERCGGDRWSHARINDDGERYRTLDELRDALPVRLHSYYYWIGARNAGNGYDSTGETGTLRAVSAQAAADEIAERGGDYGDGEYRVFARSEDSSETAGSDI